MNGEHDGEDVSLNSFDFDKLIIIIMNEICFRMHQVQQNQFLKKVHESEEHERSEQ